jgi:hypothetical protein
MSGETTRLSISLGLAIYILGVTYVKDKQMLVFSFIIDLSWTISSLAFLVFLALKYIEKHAINPIIFALQLCNNKL